MQMVEKIRVLAVAVMVLVCTGSAFSELYLYDNFSGTTIDTNKWSTAETTGGPTITQGSGIMTLDDSAKIANKACILTFAAPFQLADASDSVRVTWDVWANGVTDGNSYTNGLGVYDSNSETHVYTGQSVRPGNSVDGEFRVGASGLSTKSSSDTGDSATWYHYDYAITSASQTVSVYVYNSSWDATPETYVTDGTLVWTQSISGTLATETDLSPRFFINNVTGLDTSLTARATVKLDNVYTSVPEPATVALLGFGFLGVILKRKQSIS